jgi:hypothetical protein
MMTILHCATLRRALGCLASLVCASLLASLAAAQSMTPQQAGARLAQLDRSLADTQSEIDFWERVTLDPEILVLPVMTPMGVVAVPGRRADAVAYLAREIATDLLTGSRRNFQPVSERMLELQQLSNASKDAIRSELLRDLYAARADLAMERDAVAVAMFAPAPPVAPSAPGPVLTTPGASAPPVAARPGDGWVFDRVIFDPNTFGRRGEQVIAQEATSAGGSVTMRWKPRADCSEDWQMSWRFDEPVDFVRAGMRIPVRLHIELVGQDCNYPQGSYVSLGQQNWEPYLTAQIPFERIAAGAFELGTTRAVADSTLPDPSGDGTAEIVVHQQPPDAGQSWAIFRIFSYVPGFNFTAIYVFRGH